MEYIKKYGMIGVVLILMVASYLLTPKDNEIIEDDVIIPIETKEIDEYIYVDVKGSVVQPGVYKLKTGSRLFQVIEYAGGFLDEANTVDVNLSLLLIDQMMLYIPSIYDVVVEVEKPVEEVVDDTLININTAEQSLLETLPGIGPSTASSIIRYREQNGNFREIEEIMDVSGIGTSTFETIRNLITV